MTMAVAIIVDTTLIIALASLVCRVLRRQQAALRHTILAAALAAAAAVPLLEASLPRLELPVLPGAAVLTDASPTFGGAPLSEAGTVRVAEAAISPALTWSDALLAIWAIGVLLVLAGLMAGIARLRATLRRSRPVRSGAWHEQAASLSARLGLSAVVVVESPDPTPVMTWGLFTPRVIVPSGASAWSADRIEIVLAHELAHIARRDWAVQIAAHIVCAIYWFNPLIWIANRRLRDESEQACDDAVLRMGVSAADYASHLLAVARQVLAGSHRWASAPAIVNSSSLERRVAAMLNLSLNRQALSRRAATLVSAAVFAVTIPVVALTVTEHMASTAPIPGSASDVVLVAPETAPEPAPGVPAETPEAVQRPASRAVPAPPPAAAPAAQAPASLSGRILDSSGGTLPGVTVTMTNSATGTSVSRTTDGAGSFSFRDLSPARYELTARLPGFRSLTENVQINGGDDQQRSLVMQVGGLMETVTVNCGVGGAALTRRGVEPLLAMERRTTPRLFAMPQAAQPMPVRVGGQIAAPRRTAAAPPTCPGVPPGGGLIVILEGVIGADGAVGSIVTLRPRAADALQAPFVQAAIEAVRQWQYTPTRLNNVPVPVIVTVTVSFTSD